MYSWPRCGRYAIEWRSRSHGCSRDHSACTAVGEMCSTGVAARLFEQTKTQSTAVHDSHIYTAQELTNIASLLGLCLTGSPQPLPAHALLLLRPLLLLLNFNSLPLLQRTRRPWPSVVGRAILGPPTPSPLPAPPPSARRAPAQNRVGRWCLRMSTPPITAVRSAPLPASPPSSLRPCKGSCCPGRGRAACRYGGPAPHPACPPSR